MQDSQNYELDPNFAVVCSFLERFGKHIGDNFANLTIGDLKAFLEAKRGENVKNDRKCLRRETTHATGGKSA